MRHFFLGSMTSLVLLFTFAFPARACINDRVVDISEREFKSSYLEQPADESPSPDEETSPAEEGQLLAVAVSGAGLLLFVGAGLLCFVKKAPRY